MVGPARPLKDGRGFYFRDILRSRLGMGYF
jgi:uncharacterized protein (DUF934 family)